MLSVQRKVLMELLVGVIFSESFHPIVWLGWQACSDNAEFSFLQRKAAF